jgi:hypothetical protein
MTWNAGTCVPCQPQSRIVAFSIQKENQGNDVFEAGCGSFILFPDGCDPAPVRVHYSTVQALNNEHCIIWDEYGYPKASYKYEGVSKSFRTEPITK